MQFGKLYGYKKGIGEKNVYSLPGVIAQSLAQHYMLRSKSPTMGQVFKTLGKLLDSNIPILLCGEAGVGKEVFAKVVHSCGKQKSGSFVKIDCKKANEHILLEKIFLPANSPDDTYNHNGARQNKNHTFYGTIFLQNVEHLPADLQFKILCMLKDRIVDCPTRGKKLAMHVRYVASTRQDLWALVEKGRFRKDLFYRLSIYTFLLPPLRERTIDIGDFASHFCRLYAVQNNQKLSFFTNDAIAKLKQHTWPGNIRELHKVVLKTLEASNGQNKISNITWLVQQNAREAYSWTLKSFKSKSIFGSSTSIGS